MNIVVDAAVAVEYLLRTNLGQRAAGLIEGQALFAPEMLDTEALSALRRMVFAKLVDKKRAEEALVDLGKWSVERISHRRLLLDAWALRSQISGYDAMYVVVAQRYNALLVTADSRLAQAHGLGVPVSDLRA